MSRKRYTPEQIIMMLREAEIALAQGQTAAQVCRFSLCFDYPINSKINGLIG
jgi:hypothetical protein